MRPTMHRLRPVLTTWPFLTSLALLLLNDFWWKAAFPGWFTGKLSDVAGIAVVAMPLLALAPHRCARVYALIATGFAFWKSPLSQPVIDALNVFLPYQIGRVVDYTDLVALLILPACAPVAANPPRFQLRGATLRRALFPPVVVLTSLGLMATPAILTHRVYDVRGDSSVTLDRAQVSSLIRQVADRHGLSCEECSNPEQKAVYVNRYLRMAYDFIGTPVVEVQILKGASGVPFLPQPGARKADELQNDLTTALQGHQVALELKLPQRSDEP